MPEDEGENGKKLIRNVLHRFMPASHALMTLMMDMTPSPAAAQKYRTDVLYTGPVDDECSKAMKAAKADGPLVVFIAKMVPTPDMSRFYAIGRIFSGTISTG
jgi:elongation factor 2